MMGGRSTPAPNLRRNFPLLERTAYLDTAAEGLPPSAARESLEEYLRHKSLGRSGRSLMYETEFRAWVAAARLLGVAPEEVAFLSSASEALNLLANSIPWQPGDEVILNDLEFPSNVLPWLRLRDRGVVVKIIPSRSGVLRLEQFLAEITPRTRVVSLSYVSYLNGAKVPFLEALAQAAGQTGAIVCVDATQALGRVLVPVAGVDFLVASGYKWLLGTHGAALAYLAPRLAERISFASAGWRSVREIFTGDRFARFDFKPGAKRLCAGLPAFPAIYALRQGLELLLDIGVERIDCRLRPLVDQLRTGLASFGLDVLTPADASYASGIVSFAHPHYLDIGAELERRNVAVWAGDGRVRASVHLYNDETDVRSFLDALRELLPPCSQGCRETVPERAEKGAGIR